MTLQTEEKPPIPSSMFYMWRCIIAIAHTEGEIDPEERAYLAQIFTNMPRAYSLTPEQQKTFADDLEKPQDFASLLRFINDPEYRGLLIYYGEIMAHLGGHARPNEEAILKKLSADQMAGLDIDKLRSEVHEHIAEGQAERAAELKKMHEDAQRRNFIFRPIDVLLLKMGIDILD